MNGRVDASHRALIDISVTSTPAGSWNTVTAWIDTAFDGFLVFPRTLIEKLALQQVALTQAILADGNQVILESYACYVDWFGTVIPAQVIANDGKLPLLGTEFLVDLRLTIDYAASTVELA